VLVIGDDKLPKDGDDTFVSYTSETKTSDLVATTEVVKGNETVSTESITRLKEGSENIIL